MRVDTPAYINANNLPQKEPRFVVVLSFDWDNQDVWHFTSHDDAALPPGASVHHSVVTMSSVVQQTLAPDQARATIGSISFGLRDKGGVISSLFAAKFAGGDSLKGRRVQVYRGYAGLAWADYVPVTQQVRGADLKGRAWQIQCADVQRELRKDVFDVAVTQLAASISATDATIQVAKAADFEMVVHGPSYSDAPGQAVGYIKIENEVIRYTGKTSNSFTGCTRGVMNTVAAAHEVGASPGSDMKVEEFVYIEMPAVKAAYAVMTGVGLPKRWNLGISTALVDVAEFNAIGADLYDPANDEAGIVFRFEGLTKTDGKKFIEEQIFQSLGLFAPVKRNGALGLRRLAAPLPGSGYVAELNASNVVSIESLDLDYDAIHNWAVIQWNWDHNDKKFTRTSAGFLDTSSINAHGISEKPTTLALRGLHGSIHSADVLQDAFDYFRNSYVGPVWRTSVVCKYGLNNVEIGDFVRLKIGELTDPYTGQPLDRVVRVDGASDDLVRGTVSLTLTGATESAMPMPATDAATALSDAFYTSAGTPLQNVLTIAMTGGVGHVTANGALNGGSDMNAAGAIYYYNGDLTIDSGVVVTITQNVQIRVRGFLQVSGKIDGKGRGLAGAAPIASGEGGVVGVAGYLGTSEPMGGLVASFDPYNTRGDVAKGKYDSAVLVKPKIIGGQLSVVHGDQRGTSGGSGKNSLWGANRELRGIGGAGGAGGAALVVVCRGAGFGSSGGIDLSGENGSYGTTDGSYQGGSGAGGCPGVLSIYLDGVNADYPSYLPARFDAYQGATPLPAAGTRLPLSFDYLTHFGLGEKPLWSYWIGLNNDARQFGMAACRVVRLNEEISPISDPSTTMVQPPSAITLASHEPHLLTQRDGTQIPRLLITWTASPDVYLKGYQIQYRLENDAAWTTVSGYADKYATSQYVLGFREGDVVYVRMRSVNRYNNESEWVEAGPHAIVGKTSNPSDVAYLTATVVADGVLLEWPKVSDVDLLEYELREGAAWAAAPVIERIKANSKKLPPQAAGSHNYMIKAVDTGERQSNNVAQATVVVADPSTPVVTATISGTRLRLEWPAVAGSFAVTEYQVAYGATLQGATPIGAVTATAIDLPIDWVGVRKFWVYASTTVTTGAAGSVSVAVDVPEAPAVSSQISGADVVLTLSEPQATLPIAEYEVRYGTDFATGTYVSRSKSRTFRFPVDWGGTRQFFAAAIDANGNVSAAGSAAITIDAHTRPALVAEVIDNNVLLRFAETTGTLPVWEYEFRSGATWASGTVIGTAAARFVTRFESISGVYTYWAAAVDTAGNYGEPGSVTATVSQPPDFKLLYDQNSAFGGAKTNCVVENGTLVLPVNTTETFEAHFTARAWSTPQDQINAGYPIYVEPTLTTASYEEVINYGTTISSTMITLTANTTTVAGSVTLTPTISVSNSSATGPWTDYAGVWQAFTTAFRWIKVRLDAAATGGANVMTVNQLNIRMALKSKRDGGMGAAAVEVAKAFTAATTDVITSTAHGFVDGKVGQCTTTGTLPGGLALLTDYFVRDATANTFKLSAAPGGAAIDITSTGSGTHTFTADKDGTAVVFNETFVDVTSIGVNVAFGSSAKYALYNFVDTPNPKYFKVPLYDLAGNRVAGNFTWTTEGV